MTITDEINPKEYLNMECPINLPPDPFAKERMALIRQYNFAATPATVFDALAQEIIAEFNGVIDFAGINRVNDEREQLFVGAALLGDDGQVSRIAPGLDLRTMTAPQGACSTLITRPGVKGRTALAMNDLMDFPLFATNDMVTKLEKRTYIGAQIVAPEGIPIGTVWGVGPRPYEWKQIHLEFMKGLAARVMSILERQRH